MKTAISHKAANLHLSDFTLHPAWFEKHWVVFTSVWIETCALTPEKVLGNETDCLKVFQMLTHFLLYSSRNLHTSGIKIRDYYLLHTQLYTTYSEIYSFIYLLYRILIMEAQYIPITMSFSYTFDTNIYLERL